ncbi:MAG: NAD(P)H-hydrate dehydratase [Cyanobacteriota bacterium]|nr:NAD(P)H-hydrate dehydratase [Cyanobacteriota bacterium]
MNTQAPPSWPPRDAAHLLVSGGQMATLEQQLFASGLPVEALMEKAALAAARAIRRDWRQRLKRHGALVLVGPGHNGGDGLVIARELHLAGVSTRLWSPFSHHKPLTAAHLRHARWLGLAECNQPPDAAGAELWIDALFGIGQHRPLDAPLASLLAQRQQLQPNGLVAIDVPSGLDDTTGRPLGEAAAVAATTYCIGLIKQGLVQDRALAAVGQLQRLELALPQPLLQELDPSTPLGLGEQDRSTSGAPWPAADPAASKYQRGRLLVIAGSEAYRGAAKLALLGADASGLGSLRAALPAPLAEGLWSSLPHVVLQRPLGCSTQGALRLDALQPDDLTRLDAVLLGPGIGALEADEAAAWELLQAFEGLLLLDADGLNRTTAPWLQGRRGPTWITPHPGEFARLWPQWSGLPPLEAARRAAADCGATVLLKGARSVVAAPDGCCWQLLDAAAAAARAGLGDVLAGYAAGKGAMALASGHPCQSTWLAAAALDHASAGLRCARERGNGGINPAAVAAQLCEGMPMQSKRR